MQNIEVMEKDGELMLKIRLDRKVGTTKGNNDMVATSQNWQHVPGHPELSMNFVLVRKGQ